MTRVGQEAAGGQLEREPIANGTSRGEEEHAKTKLSGALVAIPAYNESTAIGSTVLSTKQFVEDVLVVDDGSSDATAQIASEAGANVIEHEENRGKGAAIQTIFEYAEETGHEAVVLIDGDGQHLPTDIPDVVDPVLADESEVVIGSRYLDAGETETPFYRRLGQKTLDTITTGSSGTSLTDTQSGFRAFSSEAIEELSITTDGIGVESEMIDDASQKEMDITEVPIDVRYEGIDGQTYNPLRHGLAVVVFMLQLVRDKHPLLFFGLPGLALLLFGGFYGMNGMLVYQNTGVFYPAKALVAGFSTILGVLGVFAGLILNQIANMMSKTDG
ncbi:glycosyltransferase family 2 protein [Haloarcula onubensis]|uniref:Glycosyltransferase family 2 protein n=1 Tax=Haloarcula onubensis TaxID=2950539 RepID=A0ABU2FKL2_9EURY|nr:glycosyltransferase family 2 protein [Halomicroarcula sp. S3CR25-11]MDS0280792.1 glycosyltransferase family 2 protein [Halomicroarcula sp. S3CR25-11]